MAAAGERVLLAAVAAVLAVLVPGAAAGLMERSVRWSTLLAAPAPAATILPDPARAG